MSNIRIKCPGCGQDFAVETIVKIDKIDDLVGHSCLHCSRVITEHDIISQAKKLSQELINRFRRK
ncbi:ECs_2282 family putative zinc-binding protein [Proteus mirabilis]|uniref:ECs_2282 family putative zinc-binding protein n=1 Tax=Proteus mirabilis TaxID=584 RepID=UPI0039B3F36C